MDALRSRRSTGSRTARLDTKVARVVADTLSADFENIRIVEVLVHEDFDQEGEPLLRIEVIFDGTPKAAEARAFSGAVRALRPKLEELDVTAFPLLSFISERDLGGKRRGEAAGPHRKRA